MTLINEKVQQLRHHLGSIIQNLVQLTERVEHEEMIRLATETFNSIDEPFMFVIVGEVKVGKSSFINALLESKEEICRVAPHPMTDTIQVIEWGEEVTEKSINPFLKKLTHPASILKEISVVDTPGTNTIVEQHQEITEDFIPKSDLVIFVFESKNPYRQSAWDLFQYIKKDWHKKLLFVLQQKDLMDPDDLQTNINGVKEYASKQGIEEPVVFAVSAKQELEGNKSESDFQEVRAYIEERITGGRAPVLKFLSKINTSEQIVERLGQAINDRRQQWQSDQEFREDIKTTLDEHERLSNNQINNLVQNILDSYDATTLKAKADLDTGLGFFSILRKSIGSIFDKNNNPKAWLETIAKDLESSLNLSLKEKLNNGVRDLSDSLQQMAQIAQLKIQKSETILRDDHDVFSTIAEKRARILEDLQESFKEFLSRTENFYPEDMLQGGDRLSPNVATGTGIAVLGAMLTALTNGAVFDVTGGVLTAVGLIFAGASLGFQKRKIIRRYSEEVQKGREKLELVVQERLGNYVHHIRERIEQVFKAFDQHLINEENAIEQLTQAQNEITNDLQEIKKDINDSTSVHL